DPAQEVGNVGQLREAAIELGTRHAHPRLWSTEGALDTEQRTEVAAGLPSVGQLANRREREAALLKVGDQPEARQMVVVVVADPPLDRGRREQATLLVEADRRDLCARRAGELVDREPLHRPRVADPAHISLTIIYLASIYYHMHLLFASSPPAPN